MASQLGEFRPLQGRGSVVLDMAPCPISLEVCSKLSWAWTC